MKYSLILILFFMTGTASAEKIKELHCQSLDQTSVEIIFAHAIDPLTPFTNYEFGAEVKVHSPRGVYVRKDVRMTPLKSTHDVEMRGDANGALYLRLVPRVNQGAFSGIYHGQLFVNDLDVKAYFNFSDKNSQPGLACKAPQVIQ